MKKNKTLLKIALSLTAFFLCSCQKHSKAPELSCPAVITVRQGTTFNYKNYCDVDGKVTTTDIDTEHVGVQTLTVTSEKNGSMSIYKVRVNVVKDSDAVLSTDDDKKEVEFVPCEEGTHRENGVCVADKVKPTPDPTPTPTPKPTAEPTPTPEPSSTPAPTSEPSQTSQPAQTYNPDPQPATPQPTEPVYVQPDIGHGVKYFQDYDYGDIFGAMNACRVELDSMPYGRCDPSADETYYILSW